MNRDELLKLLYEDPEVRYAVYEAGLIAGTEEIVGTNGKRMKIEADTFQDDIARRRKAWEIGAGVK